MDKSHKRDPTSAEAARISEAKARNAARRPLLQVKLNHRIDEESGVKTITLDTPHTDTNGWLEALADTFGSSSPDFAEYALAGAMEVLDPGGVRPKRYNAALALVSGIDPQNELEGALAAQMVAVNALSMDSMERAARADRMDVREAYINQATKMSRTLTSQVEALTRLRGGGKQQVEVRYVYVDARNSNNVIGVGDAGDGAPKLGQPHEPARITRYAPAPSMPMRSEDTSGHSLPVACDEGAEALHASRGQEPRSAQGGGERQLQKRETHGRTACISTTGDAPGADSEEHA